MDASPTLSRQRFFSIHCKRASCITDSPVIISSAQQQHCTMPAFTNLFARAAKVTGPEPETWKASPHSRKKLRKIDSGGIVSPGNRTTTCHYDTNGIDRLAVYQENPTGASSDDFGQHADLLGSESETRSRPRGPTLSLIPSRHKNKFSAKRNTSCPLRH